MHMFLFFILSFFLFSFCSFHFLLFFFFNNVRFIEHEVASKHRTSTNYIEANSPQASTHFPILRLSLSTM